MPSHSVFNLSHLWLCYESFLKLLLCKFYVKSIHKSWIACFCQGFQKWIRLNQVVFFLKALTSAIEDYQRKNPPQNKEKNPNTPNQKQIKKKTANTKYQQHPIPHLLSGRPEHSQHKGAAGPQQRCRMKGSKVSNISNDLVLMKMIL